jgi:hypothetical protein
MNFWSLIFSTLIHVGCVGLFFFKDSLGFKTQPISLELSPECTVPLEITAVSDISSAPISRPKIRDNIKPPSGDDPEKKVVEQLLPQPEAKPEPKAEEKPEPKAEEKVKENVEEKLADPEPIIPVKPLPKPEKKAKPEPKPKKDSKKEQIKKKAKEALAQKKKDKKKPPADFISVLSNVDKELDDGPSAETPITDPDSDSSYAAPAIGPSLSLSMIDRVRRLLEHAWHVPIGGNDGNALIVMVRIDMNRDGRVKNVNIDHSRSTPQHPIYGLACESALRAVNQFRTTPLPLPKEQYEMWKNFEFKFSRK